MYAENYYQIVAKLLSDIFEQESESIRKAGGLVADALEKDGLLYVFGCGHSHMIEEELFYRAGGLLAVAPIFETSAMLHEGAVKSSQIERMSGYASHVMDRYPIGENDVLLVVSTSGLNPFPIEMADAARAKGSRVIAVTSLNYVDRKPRTADGRHLHDAGDLVINNHVPAGDAVITVRSDGTKAGPVSSMASLFIADSIMLTACEILRERGREPDVFISGNCPEGDAYNKRMLDKFKARVRHL